MCRERGERREGLSEKRYSSGRREALKRKEEGRLLKILVVQSSSVQFAASREIKYSFS